MSLEHIKSIVKKTVDQATVLVALHENNRVFTFSKIASNNIPKSFAANTFNTMQDSLLHYELLKMTALWDHGRDKDEFSIPNVIHHFNPRNEVGIENLRLVSKNMMLQWSKLVTHKRDCDWRDLGEWEFGLKKAKSCLGNLVLCHKKIHLILNDRRFLEIRNFRDKHIAHSLPETRADKKASKAGQEIKNPSYKNMSWLYFNTLIVVELLYSNINFTGIDLVGDIRRFERKCSLELWENFRVEID